MKMNLFRGNILSSTADVICHQVNCKGVMGAGLAKQIKAKYPELFTQYKSMCAEYGYMLLGDVFLYKAEGQFVANLFAQNGFGRDKRYTDYNAFRNCLKSLKKVVSEDKKVAFPYNIGCGLAGGDWDTIYSIIKEEMSDYQIEIWCL